MNFVHDEDRLDRIGMPEAILCDGKSDAHLAEIAEDVFAKGRPVLFTRLPDTRLGALPPRVREVIDHDESSSTAILHGPMAARPGTVAVVAAGTSDLHVAREAVRTIEFAGARATLIGDVGVAGLWRLLERLDEIREADVVIVVAGMDAALLSVVGGQVRQPVIGVPTSVGYGVAAGGTSALHSMLASCAQGVLVTNIDNGFGAAAAAIRILNAMHPAHGGTS